MKNKEIHLTVRNLHMSYGSFIIQQDLNFDVKRGEIFVVMGGSGCGKSTLLRHLVGLNKPRRGDIIYNGINFWNSKPKDKDKILKSFGVLYQSGALWSSMTLAENISLPLELYTSLHAKEIKDIVLFKLSLVGLSGFEDFYPSEISGGMQKRAGLARAIALDPEILFFDEPSAGLDPVSAKLLDDLILELRASLGSTIIIVTHELASIFAIGDNSVFLDAEQKTMIALGNPNSLLAETDNHKVANFLSRGKMGKKS